MPKFYFSIEDGDRLFPTDEGLDFPNAAAAIADAQSAIAAMVRDELPDGPKLRMKVIVEDEARREIYRAAVRFDDETLKSSDAS